MTDLAIIIISLQLFVFQLITKRTSVGKSVRIPDNPAKLRQNSSLKSAAHLGLIIILRYTIHLLSTWLSSPMAQKNRIFFSFRWGDVQRFANERWDSDALWWKVRVSCRRTCLVSYYSWQGRGKGWGMMNNDFIIRVFDRNYLFFSDCMRYITKWVK